MGISQVGASVWWGVGGRGKGGREEGEGAMEGSGPACRWPGVDVVVRRLESSGSHSCSLFLFQKNEFVLEAESRMILHGSMS